ncbi:hypothetical protein Hanom_Chr06g00571131 [Helianthus anomalus]
MRKGGRSNQHRPKTFTQTGSGHELKKHVGHISPNTTRIFAGRHLIHLTQTLLV